MVTKGKIWEGDRLGGWDWHIYILLYTVSSNKDLLYSARKSFQYSVADYMGKESEQEWMYMYMYG